MKTSQRRIVKAQIQDLILRLWYKLLIHAQEQGSWGEAMRTETNRKEGEDSIHLYKSDYVVESVIV